MSRMEGQAGWVLHRRPWRESSLLVEFFSHEQGRVGLVARAARSPRSPWRGLAEPFCPLVAAWTRRGEMGTLIDLESTDRRVALQGRALWCGLYANELVMKLIARDDPAPEVFHAYGDLLSGLGSGESMAGAVRRFELRLLAGTGVAPDLEHDAASGERIRADSLYHLDPEAGFSPTERAGASVYRGDVILALASGRFDGPGIARSCRQLTRQLIDHQLAGRRLETRRLFENPSKESGS